MFAQDKLDLILRRYDEIGDKLAVGADGQAFVALSRERATLDAVVDRIRAYRAAQKESDELSAMLADASLDAEMRGLAESETEAAHERLAAAESALKLALLPKDEADEKASFSKCARRHGRRRGGAVRRRSLPRLSEICGAQGLAH
jgi:peptide chain release factor 1